jgi:SAM-dependent methyltransferase
MNRPSDSPYLQLARIVKHYLHLSHPSPSSVDDLRRQIVDCRMDINYDRLAEEFAEAYWLRNYWKAVYFFEYEFKHPPINLERVSVLGAGSAADTLAFMIWLDQKLLSPGSTSITLIDRSRKQLDLARKLITQTSDLFHHRFNIIYKHLDIRRWRPIPDRTDLIILSHFLTENPDEINNLLSKAKIALCSPGQIVVIERERDPVWKQAKSILSNLGITVYDTGLNKYYFSRLRPHLNQVSPHYVDGILSAPKYQTEIVSGFFSAWRTQSLNTVRQIFSPQAIFDEKPGLEPAIQGLPQILNYWKANPLSQNNISVSLLNSAYTGNNAICAFTGDFDTPKQHITIQGAMNFYIDPRHQKINHLTEYFGTIKTPF